MTQPLPISLSCWNYDRTRALEDGRIRPQGIDLRYLANPPEETFFRMLAWSEFDVAEMSLSSYVLSLFADDPPYIAIPVFPSRVFRHGSVYLSPTSGVSNAEELVSGKVGVPEYQMTASVWIRGILEEHHHLPAKSVTYRTGGLHERGRTEKLKLDLPEDIDVRPIGPNDTLDEMLLNGRIDALYTARAPRSFDPQQAGAGHVRRLFPDIRAAERRYFQSTSIFPIMHTVVIRRELYRNNPWIARSLYDAFVAAKSLVYSELQEVTALKSMLPWSVPEAEETIRLMGADFWPYGISANRQTLETFLRYSHAQGLAKRPLKPEELFAPETHAETRI